MSRPNGTSLGRHEDVINAFEAAVAERGEANLRDYLPHRSTSDYLSLLQELVRVDLELRSSADDVRSLEEYRHDFPELFENPGTLQPLAYEEYRLRIQAGVTVDAAEYARRYRVDTSAWYRTEPNQTDAASARESAKTLQNLASWRPGSRFLDFQIIGELGRGTFSRVYLARQS